MDTFGIIALVNTSNTKIFLGLLEDMFYMSSSSERNTSVLLEFTRVIMRSMLDIGY